MMQTLRKDSGVFVREWVRGSRDSATFLLHEGLTCTMWDELGGKEAMMDTKRDVQAIINPGWVREGAGVLLRRSIATAMVEHLDPFLLFDHFGSGNPADYLAGFPMHPHRGIETVTYMLDGVVAHRDSVGNKGTIGPGDVQWMTAGRGILHEEMPQPRDGNMEGFQVWLNLPSTQKMKKPRYQEVTADTIPLVQRQDGTLLRVIAGTIDDVSGPVTSLEADPLFLDVTLPPNGHFDHVIPAHYTCVAYLFDGECSPAHNEKGCTMKISAPRLIIFGDGDHVSLACGDSTVRFLLLAGLPFHESIVRYGPFVMNTREEILQTLQELRTGNFPPS